MVIFSTGSIEVKKKQATEGAKEKEKNSQIPIKNHRAGKQGSTLFKTSGKLINLHRNIDLKGSMRKQNKGCKRKGNGNTSYFCMMNKNLTPRSR